MPSLTTLQIVALKSLPGVGTKSILKVGDYIKAQNMSIDTNKRLSDVLKSLNIKMRNPDGEGKVEITEYDLDCAEVQANKIIVDSKFDNIGIISYYEDFFPTSLRNVINSDGKEDPVLALFYKGNISIIHEPCIAIVGTREVTPGGEKAGFYIASEFSKRGFCIVSGLAIGCDSAAHKGALKVSGKTIAFLAHGLDTVYPPQNTDIANEIVEKGGLLLSEYPIGIGVNRYNLVARDRLQAGISLATIVIQTGVTGGTMHAANATLISNKPLYTLSYGDSATNNHEKTKGNKLLVNKGAIPITANDNLDTIGENILKSSKESYMSDSKTSSNSSEVINLLF